MEAVVVGNVTLDVICWPVDDVPRRTSVSFERSALVPGGCGGNTAVGLARLGIATALVARAGRDEAGDLAFAALARAGVDTRRVVRVADRQTGLSVGLIDSEGLPRFVHTSGANALLTAAAVDAAAFAAEGARALHVGGFFVLRGMEGAALAPRLAAARARGLLVTLDVVDCPAMDAPAPLWACLPHVDVLFCNRAEGRRLTGTDDPAAAATALLARGAGSVVVKLGADGCLRAAPDGQERVPAWPVAAVVDTTGAGDAFAAGYVAAHLRGAGPGAACVAGTAAAARILGGLGALSGWFADE
jgi:sugar/nucleoside kinase (ribokinase family)